MCCVLLLEVQAYNLWNNMIVDAAAAAAAASTSAFGSLMPGLEFHSSSRSKLLPQLKQCWQAIKIQCTYKKLHMIPIQRMFP